VTIPVDVRDQFGLLPDTDVDFVSVGNTVTIVSADPGPPGRGGALARRIRGRGQIGMTTDEILALTRGEFSGQNIFPDGRLDRTGLLTRGKSAQGRPGITRKPEPCVAATTVSCRTVTTPPRHP